MRAAWQRQDPLIPILSGQTIMTRLGVPQMLSPSFIFKSNMSTPLHAFYSLGIEHLDLITLAEARTSAL